MPILYYDENAEHAGRGLPLPALNALVCEEANGDLTLTFTCPSEEDVRCGQAVLAPCPVQAASGAFTAALQPFRVKSVTRQGALLTAECPHVYFDAAERVPPQPFVWQREPLISVCEALSLLGGIRFTTEVSGEVTGTFPGSAAATARELCRKMDLQLIRDGRQALLLPGSLCRRGVTVRSGDCEACALTERLEGGVLTVRAELTGLSPAVPPLRVYDTVTLTGLPGGPRALKVNRVLWDPLTRRTGAVFLGRADKRMSGTVFESAGTPE